ncbi:hypothetical protein PLICRDRAFT_39550 [Plicaturopsis crispa FD-325 SS-3]|nr:hypothetical protein PLICRDRAFT_39550 [Plicaturopsis crispa FD-325 SS-3]
MGVLISRLSEHLPPKPKFSLEDVPDISGQIVIVTGGSSGIGKVTAKALLEHNATVYITARSTEQGESALRDLKTETGKASVHFLKLDLADLSSVKTAAEEFFAKQNQLHILYNNAGVMAPPVEQTTVDGYDLQFGTNVLGHFYLTKLLMPALLAAAKTSPQHVARIITTSSFGHIFYGLNFATFKDGPARRRFPTESLYAQSKYANIVFAKELARRYGDLGIVSIAFNPGNLGTGLQRHLARLMQILAKLVMYDVNKYGALTPLYAGTSADALELNGQYLVPWARVGYPRADTQDPHTGKELWAWLEDQVSNL